MSGERFVRVQATYCGRLGVEVGVFVAVDHLRRAGRLTPDEQALYFDVHDWFNEHLPNPDFYADGNSVGAVTWFKTPVPHAMQERVDQMRAVLSAHGVPHEAVSLADPGTVVYEDDYQIGVVPYVRAQPTPLPEGVTLTPTTAGSKRAVAASPIRHILFDADGVLQELPGGWYTSMEPYLGDRTREFMHETWVEELPMLAGRGDYMAVLSAALNRYGVVAPPGEVYAAVWHNIAVIEESLAVVRALRSNGYGVHLGTNQECYRGAYMRTILGYDALFDVSCYSYDLGVAKPDPAFFVEAAQRIGAPPHSVLFIDDKDRNVDGARQAGMAAEQWDFGQGHDVLFDLFAKHGVAANPNATPRGVAAVRAPTY